ncbi:hypothetical protein [Cellulomonas citrea]|uniref:hypothetical protein n=1 Tax=Cellulomonas citrea TaxID=1909423 RepID=UPI00135C2440|nr:hypothetical protein [Cellulomonas citrea]
MNEPRRTHDRYATERALAPHVDPGWTGAALIELRLIGVDGRAIGSVLAEVESFCAESGQSAHEAFGDPEAYVRSLDLPTDQGPMGRELWSSLGPAAVQSVGMLSVTWAVASWRDGVAVAFEAWHLVLLALLMASALLVARFYDAVIRFVVRRSFWWTWLLTMAFLLVLVGAGLVTRRLAPGVLWAAPVGAVLAAGLVLLLVGALARPPADDPVTAPLRQDAVSSRAARVLVGSSRWVIPAMTVVPVAITLLVPR